jgi:hypothetical protein
VTLTLRQHSIRNITRDVTNNVTLSEKLIQKQNGLAATNCDVIPSCNNCFK